MFEIKLKTDNAAFDEPYANEEIIRILKDVIEKLEYGYSRGSCIDINGNKVGKWKKED